ncbi:MULTISPECIES: major tail protein [Clostridium]|uniref:major tail protein n=1 Tax=Clostridium TaxID=1485 RepID=UPI00082466B4|nr:MULTISPECIES: major tail protein [Clostridium]
MATVNIDKLALAIIDKDELGVGNLVFETPEYIPGVQSFQAKVKTNTGEHYEEGNLTDQDTTLQNVEISFDLGHVSNPQMAKYFGNHVASTGGVYALTTDVAPYTAILVKYTLAGGNGHGYKIYYKGKLSPVDETYKQAEGKVDYQDTTISCTFQPLNNNKMWKYGIETIDDKCPTDIDTLFFANVIIPTEEAVSALAISSSTPANGGTNVAVSAKPAITFNNAIASNEINMFNDTDNTAVNISVAFDDAKKICTIIPSANLTAGKRYEIVVAGTKDIYGQELATTVISFTTAS